MLASMLMGALTRLSHATTVHFDPGVPSGALQVRLAWRQILIAWIERIVVRLTTHVVIGRIGGCESVPC